MSPKLVSRRGILFLIAGALILPNAVLVSLAVSSLLGAMGDATGGVVLKYVAWGCGTLWAVDLISLLVVVGLNSLIDRDERE